MERDLGLLVVVQARSSILAVVEAFKETRESSLG
jgi:hypothetical protein